MILEPITPQDMQAARVITGVAMAAFLGARLFGRHARRIRIAVASLYIAAAILFSLRYMI